MINENELRIGNYYLNNTTKPPYPVIKLTRGFWIDSSINVSYLSDLEPIPLTPEILEKCRFEKDKNSYRIAVCYLKALYLTYDDERGFYIGGLVSMFVKPYDFFITKRYFKYLHEVQNLYAALSGEELFFDL